MMGRAITGGTGKRALVESGSCRKGISKRGTVIFAAISSLIVRGWSGKVGASGAGKSVTGIVSE